MKQATGVQVLSDPGTSMIELTVPYLSGQRKSRQVWSSILSLHRYDGANRIICFEVVKQ